MVGVARPLLQPDIGRQQFVEARLRVPPLSHPLILDETESLGEEAVLAE